MKRGITAFIAAVPAVRPEGAVRTDIGVGDSGGLHAADTPDPIRPAQAGRFSPTPPPSVANEDPAQTCGANKVAMWSYPAVTDDPIYVADVRNGLCILRYEGPRSGEIAGLRFLEGNSNLGDAPRLDRPAGPA